MSSFGTPYEKFNVFDKELQDELSNRRLSDNLVEIRAPFIRYTTAVEMPNKEWYTDLAKNSGAADAFNYIAPFDLGRYSGCKFFTLGMHGLDDAEASFDSMYGAQNNNGLIVGATYDPTNSTQKIVRTSELGGGTLAVTDNRFDSPQGYPPPGIESATVERLRNGNVLKFTVNTVCYTKQQLDFLDMLAFSPGMTCILEWGNIISTQFGEKGLQKDRILNFKNVRDTELQIEFWLRQTKGGIRNPPGARTAFIKAVCAPNNYHYDYAIARIANVKTEIVDNKYKTTVIAYGVADNIMYISAYATNNPDFAGDTPNNKDNTYITSIREYFAPQSKFNYLLNNMVNDPAIVKFDEPDNANEVSGPSAAAGSGTPTNDLGQEQTFYITLDKFINYFINDANDGVAKIVNASMNISDNINSKNNKNDSIELLVGVTDINVGYNEILRSTDPSSVLIVNRRAMEIAKGDVSPLLKDYLGTVGQKPKTETDEKPIVSKIKNNQFLQIQPDGNPSGIASAVTGIWLNSKMIQEIFLQARTFHEAIETILNRLNAATEGYWDLALMYDEEYSMFRIVDGNLKEVPSSPQKIYTFNKGLPNNPSSQGVEGSEVLDIKINMDYPKLLISQLGISALNNSSGSPDRKDLNFARNPLLGPRLWDLFRKEKQTDKSKQTIQVCYNAASKVSEFVKSSLNNSMYDLVRVSVEKQLTNVGFDTLPGNTRQTLTQIFAIQQPLTQTQAEGFLNNIRSDNLTIRQVDGIKVVLGLRAKAIVTKAKTSELGRLIVFGPELRSQGNTKTNVADAINKVRTNIENNRDSLINLIDTKAKSTVTTAVVITEKTGPVVTPQDMRTGNQFLGK